MSPTEGNRVIRIKGFLLYIGILLVLALAGLLWALLSGGQGDWVASLLGAVTGLLLLLLIWVLAARRPRRDTR